MNPDRRQMIRQVFEGAVGAAPPVSIRLDIWHAAAAASSSLPAGLEGATPEQVEDRLGFCRAARYRPRVRVQFPEGRMRQEISGHTVVTHYDLTGGSLIGIASRSEEQRLAGMGMQSVKYPIENENDCVAFTAALEEAAIAADIDGFDDLDRSTGDAGLPMLILGECPAHRVMLELMGYEGFYYGLADYPRAVSELVSLLDRKFRDELWGRALSSNAELLLHGSHFSDILTPPGIFRTYFAPYFADFIAAAHAAGKRVLWHADAQMQALFTEILELGFDGADCLATAPLVPQTLEDCYEAWQGRIVCWGGLPGIVFDPAYPEAAFRRHLEHLSNFTRGKPGFIIGASDNVMPGAVWERVLAVREEFAQ